jgi:hypothetical protein
MSDITCEGFLKKKKLGFIIGLFSGWGDGCFVVFALS